MQLWIIVGIGALLLLLGFRLLGVRIGRTKTQHRRHTKSHAPRGARPRARTSHHAPQRWPGTRSASDSAGDQQR